MTENNSVIISGDATFQLWSMCGVLNTPTTYSNTDARSACNIYREDMLVDWISAIADHKLEQQHEHLVELLERTVALLPPTLREMMRRNKNISQTTTGRTTK